MSDVDAEILRVALPLRPEARRTVGADAREIAFLRVVDESTGRVGFGECAPLAGLHREGLDEAVESLEEWIDGVRALDALPPSAAFAASTACAMLDGFGAAPCAAAKVAAFFAGGLGELDARTIAALSEAPVIKLKIGRAGFRDERAFLERAFAAWPEARFRLDGNRRMALEDCLALLRGLDLGRIEYVEEPLAEVGQSLRLSAEAGVMVALDELAAEPGEDARSQRAFLAEHGSRGTRKGLDAREGSGDVGAWVLRASAIGSLESIRARAEEAARLGVDVVLSTAYESSFALRVAVHLAAALPNARRAHGIGTAPLLAEDSCAPAVAVRGEIVGNPLPVPFAEAWT